MRFYVGLAVTALIAGMALPAGALEAGYVSGNWRDPMGGTCDAPYLKGGARQDTKRGEPAMLTTVTTMGTTVTGQLIIEGARRGQLIDPATDKAMWLVDAAPGTKLVLDPIGPPALAWPKATLEFCPGTKPAQ